jgi:long-chain acyl-CoA synthetase
MNLCAMALGATTYLVSNPLEILKHMPSIEPDVFIGVPRFYEKLFAGIEASIAAKPPMARAVARMALDAGRRYCECVRAHRQPSTLLRVQHALAERLVLSRIRRIMGTRVRYMISGSAPMQERVLAFFHSIGLLILEAYGLSENIVPMAMNTPEAYRFGTVGKPLAVNQLRFDAGGEVLVRGPGVFAGYRQAEDSRDRFTEDGYFRTGDFAELDADGFLRLTGRKSDLIKTSAGRRIAPAGIESVLLQAPGIDQVVVVGAGRKCLIALLTLEPGQREQATLASLKRDVAPLLDKIASAERPAGFLALRAPFTIEGGELTANLKLRRAEIERKYAAAIDRLYDRLDQPNSTGAREIMIELL